MILRGRWERSASGGSFARPCGSRQDRLEAAGGVEVIGGPDHADGGVRRPAVLVAQIATEGLDQLRFGHGIAWQRIPDGCGLAQAGGQVPRYQPETRPTAPRSAADLVVRG